MTTRGKGEGSIFKDARGLWTVAVELPSHDGRRRRKVIRSKNKRVVVSKLSELKHDLEKLGDLPTTTLTVEQWMTYWFEQVASKRLRPNTASGYRSVIRNQIVPEIGAVNRPGVSGGFLKRSAQRIVG